MAKAWLRSVPGTFDRAIAGPNGRRPDVAVARQQHSSYRERLVSSGLAVTLLAADDRFPDCVFIEDTAVLLGDVCVLTRPGAPERRGEVEGVADVLIGAFELARITEPAVVDGGDVMVLDDVVFVGLSHRTNETGYEQLAAIARGCGYRAVPVPVERVLHLKSGVLPVGDSTLVVTPGTVDETTFSAFRIVHEDEDERDLFSALPLSDRLLTTAGAPRTNEILEELGFPVEPIEISEILAADGGLTCISLISGESGR